MREEGQGTPTDNPERWSIWQQVRSTESLVETEEPEFQVNLRIEGVAQDVIQKDEGQTGQIQKVVDKLRTGSHVRSIIEDMGKTGKSISSAKSRVVQFTNWETLSCTSWEKHPEPCKCQSCLKHVPEGLVFCSYSVCLRPNEEQIQRIKTRVEVMIVRYNQARVNYSRGKKQEEGPWQKEHWKAEDALRGARKNNHDSIVLRCQKDEKYRESSRVHGWTEDYCRYLDYLTTIDISCSAPWHQRRTITPS